MIIFVEIRISGDIARDGDVRIDRQEIDWCLTPTLATSISWCDQMLLLT